MNKMFKNIKLEKVIPCCLVGLLALIIGVMLLLNKYGIIKKESSLWLDFKHDKRTNT